jgi:spermidine/putrescine transport system ATP-binding protein
MSDRIAVMNQGRIEQLGDPRQIYQHPETPFVADFVGVLNALELQIDSVEGEDAIMRLAEGDRLVVPTAGTGVVAGGQVLVAVRPERVQLRRRDEPVPEHASLLNGTIAQIVYLGTMTQFHVDTSAGRRLIAHRLSDDRAGEFAPDDAVTLTWARDDASILRSG